jgi:phage FluMu protein Com
MAFRFRCAKCGKRLTVNEAPGAEVACPHCNQAIAVPADAQSTEAAGLATAPAPADTAAQAGAPPPAEGAPEGEEEEQPQGGMDTVMAWLALYLPSWGTSIVLHAAVFLLLAFVSWQTQAVQPPFEYKSQVIESKKPITEKRKITKDMQQTSRGRNRPGPSTSIVRQFTQNPVPDVASNNMEVLQVIGVGGGGKEIGGFEGLGSGGRGFFGAGTEGEIAHRIVYIVDRSGSMTDSIDYVKYELKRSIGELGEDTEFHVIFYSSGPPVEMPTRRLVAATERNKQLAFEFIDSIIAQGETDPSKALERAFACGAELIYLLTDGEFDKEIVSLVKRSNVGNKVTVHTIGFLYKTGEAVLKDIASQNNGNYKFVSDKDLETLTQ